MDQPWDESHVGEAQSMRNEKSREIRMKPEGHVSEAQPMRNEESREIQMKPEGHVSEAQPMRNEESREIQMKPEGHVSEAQPMRNEESREIRMKPEGHVSEAQPMRNEESREIQMKPEGHVSEAQLDQTQKAYRTGLTKPKKPTKRHRPTPKESTNPNTQRLYCTLRAQGANGAESDTHDCAWFSTFTCHGLLFVACFQHLLDSAYKCHLQNENAPNPI